MLQRKHSIIPSQKLKETKLFTLNKIIKVAYKLFHYFNKYKSFSGENALAITFHMQNYIEKF